jgi:hypothetical protein
MGPAADAGKRGLLGEEEQAEVEAEEVELQAEGRGELENRLRKLSTSSSGARPPRPSSASGYPARALPPPSLQLLQVVPDPNAANTLGFYIALAPYFSSCISVGSTNIQDYWWFYF